MQAALQELPLALFSTLGPIGAGGFFFLVVAQLVGAFDDAQRKRVERLLWVPFAFVAVGFIAATFHLANPFNALHVFAGVGSSPLSNEVAFGVVFAIVALVYVVLSMMGKLSDGARMGLSALVAILSVVFAALIAAAYGMPTIASWNTPLVYAQIFGYFLVGGAALGLLVLLVADAQPEKGVRTLAVVALLAGLACAAIGLIGQCALVAGLPTVTATDVGLSGQAVPWVAVALVLLAGGSVLAFLAMRKTQAKALAIAAVTIAVIGAFLGRLVFYLLQVSVGISLM